MQRLLESNTKEGHTYFQVKEINIKFQNLVIFSFKIKMKHKTSLSVSEKILKNHNINNIFIVSLFKYLFHYVFWFKRGA